MNRLIKHFFTTALLAAVLACSGCATGIVKETRPYVYAQVDGASFEVRNVSQVDATIGVDEATGTQTVSVKTTRKSFYKGLFATVSAAIAALKFL